MTMGKSHHRRSIEINSLIFQPGRGDELFERLAPDYHRIIFIKINGWRKIQPVIRAGRNCAIKPKIAARPAFAQIQLNIASGPDAAVMT